MSGGVALLGYQKEGGKVGDNLHTTTRYGENEPNEERKNSLGVVFRNWHGGPLLYQWVGDALSFQYAHAGLHMIHNMLDHPDLYEEYLKPREIPSDYPEPVYCEEQYCKVQEAPLCYDAEIPVYGTPYVEFIDPQHELYPYKDVEYGYDRWDDAFTHLIPKKERD
eukprot:UN33262